MNEENFNVNQTQTDIKHKKKWLSVLKKIGKVMLFILECIGYLIMCLTFVWLFIDITDSFKKKK